MLPSLALPAVTANNGGPSQGSIGQGTTVFVKQLKKISSSPIRNNILKNEHNHLRTQSADCNQQQNQSQHVKQTSDNNNNNNYEGSTNCKPQSIAILRVMKSIRQQRLIQQQTQEEINLERKSRADKTLLKNTQRHRQRAEVYAINAYLRSLEQQRYQEMMQSKFRGETSRHEITYDSDSSNSRDSDHSDDQNNLQKTADRSSAAVKKPPRPTSPTPKPKNPSRGYGV